VTSDNVSVVRERSKSNLRFVAATVIAGLLLPASAYARSDGSNSTPWQDHAVAGFDAVILRPLGVVAIVIGAVYVIPVAAMTWPSGREKIDVAVERFVTIPTNYVFTRPLGDL